MNKKIVYCIEPPCFEKFNTEKNIYSVDGIFAFLITHNTGEYLFKIKDYSFSQENCLVLFDDLQNIKPDIVYLNLENYNLSNDIHLVVGIKKFCPNCKLIVGLNDFCFIEDNLFFNFESYIDDIFQYDNSVFYFLKDIDESNFDFITPLLYYYCNNKYGYIPIYVYNNEYYYFKSNLVLINKYHKNKFAFKILDYFDLDWFKMNLKQFRFIKNFRYILDIDYNWYKNDFKVLEKFHFDGYIFNCNSFEDFSKTVNLKNIKKIVLLRLPICKSNNIFLNKKMYIEFLRNPIFSFSDSEFFYYKQKKLLDLILKKLYINKDEKKFFRIINPLTFIYFHKYALTLQEKKTKII